jgi:hypothetical protein
VGGAATSIELFFLAIGLVKRQRSALTTRTAANLSRAADTMASVYKTLSKSKGDKPDAEKDGANGGVKRNKQRVLILSSRGVTYRYGAAQSNETNPIADGGDF